MPRTAQISKTNEYQLKMERTRRQWPSRRLRTPSSMPRAAPTRRTSAPRPSMTSPLGAPRPARCATLVSSVPIALERAARSHPGLHSRTRKDRPHATVKERVREATALGRNRWCVLRSVLSSPTSSACAMSKSARSFGRSVHFLTRMSQPMGVERQHLVKPSLDQSARK